MAIDAPEKCVIVVDGELPVGLALNTAAILSLTVGRHVDGVLGDDVKDADGFVHRGITSIPVPILKGDTETLASLVVRAAAVPSVFVVDFTRTAQTSRTYDEYTSRMSESGTAELPYVGVAVAGPRKAVDKLVGSFALYR
ncbi:hypothetical protein BS329_34090 [Amycolatopsis coloradensis]|uniref:DUF2000 domain-containing protein n=1 Tax=Amycolatopsis coloradensis TaxID=76021 RepID=A0A1R0KI65_9PSEU|nr:DUF2000 domain-containing protein [Amycolatopsis coloradensis]OLZ45453.1 hypothetical protein BS329_34090 [Amycolatopsis coloradensis]